MHCFKAHCAVRPKAKHQTSFCRLAKYGSASQLDNQVQIKMFASIFKTFLI